MKIMTLLLIAFAVIQISGCSAGNLPDKNNSPDAAASDSSSSMPLSARLDVPEHYQAEYTSESGISVITIDADVIVPEVSSVSVYEAIPRPFTEEELTDFISRHLEDMTWWDTETKQNYTGYLATPKREAGEYDSYYLWINEENRFYEEDGDYYSIFYHYGLDDASRLCLAPTLQYVKSRYNIEGMVEWLPLVNQKAEGCTISLEQALAYADEEVAALAPDYHMIQYGQIPVWEASQNPQYYIFRYTKQIDGIPVNDCLYNSQLQNTYGFTSGLGSIAVVVRDDGVCSLTYENPYDLGELVEADVSLLSFEEVMEIFETTGMLSIQHLEMYEELEENTMNVYEIRLGYMSVRQSQNIDAYYYLPVWDFYATRVLFGSGDYAHGKDYEPTPGHSVLTINAIDGTVIDRDYGY